MCLLQKYWRTLFKDFIGFYNLCFIYLKTDIVNYCNMKLDYMWYIYNIIADNNWRKVNVHYEPPEDVPVMVETYVGVKE